MTTNITNVKDYTVTGTFDVDCSFKADKDSIEQKQVTLRFRLVNVPLLDIITPALSTKRINFQNGPGRKKFDSWKNRSVIELDFTSPGKMAKTREEVIAETKIMFMKAGIDEETATELAIKAVDNPEILA